MYKFIYKCIYIFECAVVLPIPKRGRVLPFLPSILSIVAFTTVLDYAYYPLSTNFLTSITVPTPSTPQASVLGHQEGISCLFQNYQTAFSKEDMD